MRRFLESLPGSGATLSRRDFLKESAATGVATASARAFVEMLPARTKKNLAWEPGHEQR